MRFSTTVIAVIAALPSAITAFSLSDLNSDLGDANKTCASQYGIPLMSCGILPGPCSPACAQQLQSLETTLQSACKDSKNPQGLLLSALNNGLVGALCKNPVASASSANSPAPTTFMNGPGKVAPSSVKQISVTGVVSSAGSDPSAAGLLIDTSTPQAPASQTVAYPSATYAPSTLQTSSGPSPTSNSNSNSNSNGSPFSSQDDTPNSAIAVRTGVLGVVIGFLAIIVNIA
ncbi:hypothetical protein TWF694_000823 [Orbilia ellipsospora]|uniref:Uncharacterized protein n=1 Tax=Orbilia ellipsospora TaxID=2528407 RepID=A0AAV9XWF0_9PEZI